MLKQYLSTNLLYFKGYLIYVTELGMSRTRCPPISALRFYWKRFWLGFFTSTSKSQRCPKIKFITIVVMVIIIIFKVFALLICLGGKYYEANWTFSDLVCFVLGCKHL